MKKELSNMLAIGVMKHARGVTIPICNVEFYFIWTNRLYIRKKTLIKMQHTLRHDTTRCRGI